jgi:hypothetical protein
MASMAPELPRRPEQHVIGDAAMVLVESLLPNDWVVRRQDGHGDYGIDLEVEMAGSTVTGDIFKAQVRGHRRIAWTTDETHVQSVRASTLAYWRATPLPVVLFTCDLARGEAYWEMATHTLHPNAVTIRRSHQIPGTVDELCSNVLDWLRRRGAQATISAVPVFVGLWREAKERADRDCFAPVGDREYAELLWIYDQTILLRQALGLRHGLIPWSVWVSRSQASFGSLERFYWATHDEVLAYLEPFIAEALGLAAVRLREDLPSAENVVAKNWAEQQHGQNSGHTICDPLGDVPLDFWERMDRSLEEVGARRVATAEMIRARQRGGARA